MSEDTAQQQLCIHHHRAESVLVQPWSLSSLQDHYRTFRLHEDGNIFSQSVACLFTFLTVFHANSAEL